MSRRGGWNPARRTSGTRRRAIDGLAVGIATLAGVGFVPLAPGTVASLATLVAALPLLDRPALLIAALVLLLPLSLWASGRAARRLRARDPGAVVIDEAAGMLIVLAYLGAAGWRELASGFVLFRLFDIVKPPPLRALEKLPGGVGIVADDLGAGVLTVCLLAAARLI